KLQSAGMVSCGVCGDPHVEIGIMGARVRPARYAATAPAAQVELPAAPSLSAPAFEMDKAVSDLINQIEANSVYVG
ncbi:DUF1178 domain-containing protein, partial [Shimia thalassica]|uniref:DUF1178 family protein n=1 Tax=Shimia thalassica TaxID=1715693 RepID=UPI00270CC554|nr:DUF1178 domain-containing protein [Shimia thalassica]